MLPPEHPATTPAAPADPVAAWQQRTAPQLLERSVAREIPSPALTVAVIAYRSPDGLIDCLRHIERACERAGVAVERLLADCGGNERFQGRLDGLADTVLRLERDISLNAARNVVLAWSAAPLVMLIDDDGLLEPDAVQAMLRHFKDPSVIAARGRILFNEHRYFTTLATHYDHGWDVIDDTLATEGHMAVRRDHALRAGGFDERLFGHEGLELTYRLLRDTPEGRVLYAPDVVMHHDFVRGFRHFVRKMLAYHGLRDAVVALHADDPRFVAFADADNRRYRPGPKLRPDEWIARTGLRAFQGALGVVNRFRTRGDPESWGHASPRRHG
jgi:glycosyltransferase involved in cell wall biosynthesis